MREVDLLERTVARRWREIKGHLPDPDTPRIRVKETRVEG